MEYKHPTPPTENKKNTICTYGSMDTHMIFFVFPPFVRRNKKEDQLDGILNENYYPTT